MNRGVSTVLDVALFLLLVSAAASTLVLPQDARTAPDPNPERTVVATATTSVSYSLAPGARRADPATTEFDPQSGPEFERHAHGSVAGLLADAATRNVTVDGEEVTHTADGFERAVATAAANATGRRTRVRVTWQPFRGSSIGGRVTAGDEPPTDARVGSSTLTLDSGFPDARDRALAAANRSGFAGVADVVARSTVEGLLPPDGMRLALHGDYPVDRLAVHRYRRVAALVDANVSASMDQPRPREVNPTIRRTLSTRFERRMRETFDSPGEAARAVGVGEVRIVVRRWSR